MNSKKLNKRTSTIFAEKPDFVKARHHWQQYRDPSKALALFPPNCVAERAVLHSLSKQHKQHDNNSNTQQPQQKLGYLQALQAIPRNLRLMYVHAVQSFIWNVVASARIKRFGLRVVKGDLVALHNPMADERRAATSAATTSSTNSVNSDSENTLVDADGDKDMTGVDEARQARLIEVKVVESDAEAAQCSLDDLVLPLPGYAVTYPTNEIGNVYVEEMEKFGLHPHHMARKHRYVFVCFVLKDLDLVSVQLTLMKEKLVLREITDALSSARLM